MQATEVMEKVVMDEPRVLKRLLCDHAGRMVSGERLIETGFASGLHRHTAGMMCHRVDVLSNFGDGRCHACMQVTEGVWMDFSSDVRNHVFLSSAQTP